VAFEKAAHRGEANFLARWSEVVRRCATRLAAIYVYFDNDQDGYAVHNALLNEDGIRRIKSLRIV